MSTPREDGFSMPGEFAPHERTLMAWPAREALWGPVMDQARSDYAAVANAIAAFEPVTMVVRPGDEESARPLLSASVDLVELPIDDSWMRDAGPIFVTDGTGARAASVFDFNAWGERFTPYEDDAQLARRLADHLGVPAYEAGMVLEGGSILSDGAGTVLTTEQCLLSPNRNPALDRSSIEQRLLDFLGAERIVWLGEGLIEDRDTDGHVDLIAAFTGPRAAVLQTAREDNANFARCAENVERATAAGISVIPFIHLAYGEVAGERVAMSYLNLYLCNGAAIVPVSGDPATDDPALAELAEVFPEREIIAVPGMVLAYGGGGPHCITQQVPEAGVR